MALMRRDPLSEIDAMRRSMEQLVDSMMGGGLPAMPVLGMGRAFSPNVEVYATDADVVIKAELPGLEAKDVELEITEEAVRLSGEMHKEEEIEEDNYYRSERQYGHFERLIPLPNRVKDDQAKASFKNGVLTIRAPLAEEVKKLQARKLEIES